MISIKRHAGKSRGLVSAPHALAAQSAAEVLRDGGNAVEAMISAAATIAVVYPHMNSLGGDGFWLIARPGAAPLSLRACGAAAAAANIEGYREQGCARIPFRGPLAANTVAGTVSGWDAAYRWSSETLGGRLPLGRLLEDAIAYARCGIGVTASQALATQAKRAELEPIAGFTATFLPEGSDPVAGSRFVQPRLAATLAHLVDVGLADFYRGDLARSMADDLQAIGSPLALADLQDHRAVWTTPLMLRHSLGRLYNTPPPTQGLVSLAILGQLDRLSYGAQGHLSSGYVHACVEATKLAFGLRDRHLTDPAYMRVDAQQLLASANLDAMAQGIRWDCAAPWGGGRGPADTVWMGAIDGDGVAVSFIQSIYHEFGSGVVLEASGINWQNRGASFSLDPTALNALMPRRLPFHTLNPALARFDDGRVLVYGNMGGDGQPQSQAAVFTRIARFGLAPQEAISAPRWLLGRTWGQESDSLKVEARFPLATVAGLRALGHEVEVLGGYDETMGHAGAVLMHADGSLQGGADPRSDGAVLGASGQ